MFQDKAVTQTTGRNSTSTWSRTCPQASSKSTGKNTCWRPRTFSRITQKQPQRTWALSSTPSWRRSSLLSPRCATTPGRAYISCTSSAATCLCASVTSSSRNCLWRSMWYHVPWGNNRSWASTITTTASMIWIRVTTTTATQRLSISSGDAQSNFLAPQMWSAHSDFVSIVYTFLKSCFVVYIVILGITELHQIICCAPGHLRQLTLIRMQAHAHTVCNIYIQSSQAKQHPNRLTVSYPAKCMLTTGTDFKCHCYFKM